jgi:hypothetical protein
VSQREDQAIAKVESRRVDPPRILIFGRRQSVEDTADFSRPVPRTDDLGKLRQQLNHVPWVGS